MAVSLKKPEKNEQSEKKWICPEVTPVHLCEEYIPGIPKEDNKEDNKPNPLVITPQHIRSEEPPVQTLVSEECIVQNRVTYIDNRKNKNETVVTPQEDEPLKKQESSKFSISSITRHFFTVLQIFLSVYCITRILNALSTLVVSIDPSADTMIAVSDIITPIISAIWTPDIGLALLVWCSVTIGSNIIVRLFNKTNNK